MKIAIPDLGFGPFGGYRVLSRLATEWTLSGHDVTFYVPESSPRPYHPTEAKVEWIGRNGQRVPAPDNTAPGGIRTSAGKARELVSIRLGLQRYARDADIVFASHSFVALTAFLTRTRARTVFYSQLYEQPGYAAAPGRRRWGHELLCIAGYLAPIAHVVNAPIYLDYPLTRTRDWVPPGLDWTHFFPSESTTQKSGGVPFRIGTIGRVEPEKGTRYALEAFRVLRDAGENVELHVAFGGLDEETLSEPGIYTRVPAGDAELGDFYRSVDVHVATPTYQFGAPHYPVMEPMACGIPVVTTGYLPADDTNAWIVPPHDAQAIARAILSVRDGPEGTRLKVEKGLADIAPFSWSAAAEKMMGIFSRVSSRTGAREWARQRMAGNYKGKALRPVMASGRSNHDR